MAPYFPSHIRIFLQTLIAVILFAVSASADPFEIAAPGDLLSGAQLSKPVFGFDTMIFDKANSRLIIGIQELRTTNKIVLSDARIVDASYAGTQAFFGVPDSDGIIDVVSLQQNGPTMYLESDEHEMERLTLFKADSAVLFEPGDKLASGLRRLVGESIVTTVPVAFTTPIPAITVDSAGFGDLSRNFFALDPRGVALRADEDGHFPLVTGRYSFDRLGSAPTVADVKVINDVFYHCHPEGDLIFVNPTGDDHSFNLRFNTKRGTCQLIEKKQAIPGNLIQLKNINLDTGCLEVFRKVFQR